MQPRRGNSLISGWLPVISPAVVYPALIALFTALLDKLPVPVFPQQGAALSAKLLLLPWLLFRYRAEAEEYREKLPPADLLICLVTGLGIGGMSAWLGKNLGFGGTPAPSLMAALDLCLLGPVCEELVFRGLVMGRGIKRLGRTWGFAAGVLLFAAAHSDWRAMLLAIPAGVVLGIAMEREKKLLYPVLIHITANTAVYLLNTRML